VVLRHALINVGELRDAEEISWVEAGLGPVGASTHQGPHLVSYTSGTPLTNDRVKVSWVEAGLGPVGASTHVRVPIK
jgi:hypothetical protein